MLILSGLAITLSKSKYYVGMAAILHAFTVYVLWKSALPMAMVIGLTLVLFASFVHIALSGKPYPMYSSLTFTGSNWILKKTNIEELSYTRLRVSFDAGFFLWLNLTGENGRKSLLIFYDQVTHQQLRALNIASKLKGPC